MKWKVWMHHFDQKHRDKLLSPWYSGLFRGKNFSVGSCHKETGQEKYKKSAEDVSSIYFGYQ